MKKPDHTSAVKLIYEQGNESENGLSISVSGHVSANQQSAQTWITAPGGTSVTFGHIPQLEDRYDPERCCPIGEIRLLVGSVAAGFGHLSVPERKNRFGRAGPIEFVYSVTRHYDEIWVQQERNSLLLLRRDGNKAVVLSRKLVEGTYTVITAFSFPRGHNGKKRREVRIWPKSGW